MAYGGDIEMDDVMADEELLPFTGSGNVKYSSDEEALGSVPKKENLGYISDEEAMDITPYKESAAFVSSEKEDEEGHTTIRRKIPFSQRLNTLLRPEHEKFREIENYFLSLLRTPGISIDDILQGTFDDHEIKLITPQSGPPDLVAWQRRNAQWYHDTLETRFKGATDTLAMKLTCLYFGFQVEPLRMGTLPFSLPPDPEPLDAKTAAFPADPLAFLNKYNTKETLAYGRDISLRGGGISAFSATKKKAKGKAVQEIPVKDEEMDLGDWFSQHPHTKKLAMGFQPEWLSKPKPKKTKKIKKEEEEEDEAANFASSPTLKHKKPTKNSSNESTGPLRVYGWQGSMNTSPHYVDFVRTVDRLISNWSGVDRPICVEIWRTSPLKFVENAFGTLRHAVYNPPGSDKSWKLVQRYFEKGGNDNLACFVRVGDEGEATDANRPGGYQPSTTEPGIVRIEDTIKKEVAYMRVPQKLRSTHKPHQFSKEYMLAMQVLFFTDAPHAWVLYQHDYIGAGYQYLDPPGGLWDQVVEGQSEWSPLPTISFMLKNLEHAVVPVVIPGVFTSRKLPHLDRDDFKLTNSTKDGVGLSKVFQAVELCLEDVKLKGECCGFEVWLPGTNFNQISQQPTRIAVSSIINNKQSLQDWQGFLASVVIPDGGFCLVVRPVYKTYRLQGLNEKKKVDLPLIEYDLAQFKAFVRKRIDSHYNPQDSSHVVTLTAADPASFQPELSIHHNTTEEQWQWIRRNIIVPELVVSIEDLGNEWSIPQKTIWGPRYAALNNSGSIPTEQGKSATVPSGEVKGGIKGEPTSWPINPAPDITFGQHHSVDEVMRMKMLRERTFSSVNSIFTNPLKPVMPLHGPPLESMIKTGPGVPGVSIAMMTPTEMLRLQHEVHSLRFQLLDRTRECPYADCDRYFTFADSAGLDQHVRMEHRVMRCFLCNKNDNLLPYYDIDQIAEHFESEHVTDILQKYGQASVEESVPERLCDLFFVCGAITTRMDQQQLAEHMKTHQDIPKASEKDIPDEDSLFESIDSDDSDLSLSDLEHDKEKESSEEDDLDSLPKMEFDVTPPDTSSEDTDSSISTIVIPNMTPEKPKAKKPETKKPKVKKPEVKKPEAKKPEVKQPEVKQPEVKTPLKKDFWSNLFKYTKEETAAPTAEKTTNKAFGTPIDITAYIKNHTEKKEKKIPTVAIENTPQKVTDYLKGSGPQEGEKAKKKKKTVNFITSPKPSKKKSVPVVNPKTEPNFDIHTAYNPNYNKGTAEEAKKWIQDAAERHAKDGGKQHVSTTSGSQDAAFEALGKINPKPGTAQENWDFVKGQLAEYVALGGKLSSDTWPDAYKSKAPASKAKNPNVGFQYILNVLEAQALDEDDDYENEDEDEDGDGEKKKTKRKRSTESESGSDAYEYSERSAVSDPVANLDPDAPPSPKKQRAARDAAESSSPSPSLLSFPSSSSESPISSVDLFSSSGSEEGSESG